MARRPAPGSSFSSSMARAQWHSSVAIKSYRNHSLEFMLRTRCKIVLTFSKTTHTMESVDTFDSFVETAGALLSNVTSSGMGGIGPNKADNSGLFDGLVNETAAASVSGNSNGTDLLDSELFWREISSHYNLDPKFDWKIPQYYSLPYQIIGTFFQGIIFIVVN
ncbi:hypothetical protein TYRP_005080 [Tyrophagus putrescentiae]|nr:hypothetical protein TYRP_005080 [Tyrophagus putrescentiae]